MCPDILVVTETVQLLVDTEIDRIIETIPATVYIETQSVITELLDVQYVPKVLELSGINRVLEIQVAGLQGPSSEELMPFAEQADFVGDTLIYRGYAVPGASLGSPVWRIKQITIATDGDVSVKWPAGDAGFNYVWTDRASYGFI